MDVEELRQLQELRSEHLRRLRTLELQEAKWGMSVPPHIVIEIEDLKRKIKDIDQRLKGGTTQPQATASRPTSAPLDRAAFFNLLNQYFAETDLRDLCFIMNIDYETLNGNNKRDKARELILLCERKTRTQELEAAIRQERADLFK